MASCHQTHPPFEVTVQRDNAVATVMVSGEVDLATVPRLSAAVAQHHDAQLLVLDLTAVTFIDTTGVRVLIEADRSCAGSGSRVVVLAATGRCGDCWTCATWTAGSHWSPTIPLPPPSTWR